MKILHYALGFPPYRTGGLTKFCVDLIVQQKKEGNEVALVWPGEISIFSNTVKIRKHSAELISNQEILNYEIINPLPVSFDEGIIDVSAFIKDDGYSAYKELIESFKPDIVHVHTLMGLHKSFLSVARNKGIRLVFTAHDFFPICPKVTMFRHGMICTSVENCDECALCNSTALSLKKILILQSPLYRRLKNSYVVKRLRKQHRDEYLSESAVGKIKNGNCNQDYVKLREYYYSLLKMMDVIHYNSTVTKFVYEKYFYLPNSKVINITHSDIRDRRKKKTFESNILRIRYLGPAGGGKGFFLLKAALDELWSKRQDFCLDIHFTPTEMSPYINVHGRYTYADLKKIFDDTDVLLAPSIWYETFGYTALEALSYGVPIIISDTVGAKDILVDGAGIVINEIDPQKLCNAIQNLTIDKLVNMNKVILERQKIMTIENMSNQIETKCYNWKV